jgi:opacity protein-like surface antigen
MRLLRESAMVLALAAASLAAVSAGADDRYTGPAYYNGPAYAPYWQGLYAGVHVGIGDGDGFVGGGQIGHNWVSGRIVYGIEGDFSFSDIGEEASGCIPGAGCVFAGASLDWLATVRGRVGYLIDPRILAYATAGFGIASWSAEAGVSGPGGSMRVELDGTETDFVYGLGVEGKISEIMTARIEYFGFGDFDVDIVRLGLNFRLGW